MNIVFFALSMNKGGAERVIANLCNDYLSKENNVTIVTCTNSKPQYKLKENIKLICLDNSEEQKNENKISRFIRRRKKLKKVMNEISADVMIAFLPEPCFLALSIKKTIKCPIIISVRNDPKIEYSFLPYKILMKILYPKSDGIVFQTEDAKKYFDFSKNLKKVGTIIANPLNKEFMREPFRGERKKEIVAVGRLFKQKNYPLLIKAFSNIHSEIPEYKLKIYGEGDQREVLQKLIGDLKIENKVELCGQKDNIKECIYDASLFVMSSDFEGMPNSLMEAMASGLPVISTDCPCGGPKSLIKNKENGILVKVNDEKELSNSIIEVLKDKKLLTKISENATKISEKFAPEIIYEQWGKYIKKIVKEFKK